MEKLRKIFVVSVMMITVLSMSVVVVPNVNAAAPAGSLIKMNGLSSIYYLGADGKRYVFPNESTFFSWYGDFSMVVTVPQSELESYPLGANVTVRPGTKLVKITTDPKVYAVEPNGTLLWIPSETVAMTLFGSNWAKRVIDVSDAFFTNYRIDSARQATATTYPTGSLVKFGGAADVYYIAADGKAQKITSEAAFVANRFNWNDVITAPASVTMPAAGTDITGVVATLTDTSSGAGGTAGAGTGVTVALASDTPAAVTTLVDTTALGAVEQAQALIPVTKLNFTAAADGDVAITTLKFKRAGVPSADTDFAEFYLYDGATLLAKYSSISTGVLTFTNAAGLFTVTKGTTKAVTLKVSLDKDAANSRAYNFSVNAASDITTNGAAVSGSFPMTGNTMSTATVTDLGKLTVAHSLNSSAPDPGTVGHTLWKFTLAGVDQDISIEKMKFTMIGTASVGDITNFKLDVAGTQIGSTVASMASDKTITFDLTTPYVIAKGNTKTVSLKGDIVGGTSRTYQIYLYDKEDVVAKDVQYGVYLTPNQADTWTKVQAAAATTINAGALTVSKNTTSPTGNVAKDATNVEIGKFDFKSTGESIKIDSIVASTTLGGDQGLYQVKLYVDGSQVGTAQNLTDGDGSTFSLSNSFIIPAGGTKTLVAKADMKTSANGALTANSSFTFTLNTVNYTKQTSGGTASVGNITGNTLTVRTGALAVAKNSSFGDRSATIPTGTVSATEAKIGSFVVTAGTGEAIDVTSFTLKDGGYPLANNFQNMKLKNGTTQLGNTISNLNSATSTYDFSPSTAIRVLAGAQYVVDIYADIKGAPTNSAVNFIAAIVDSVSATGVTTSQDASATSQSLWLQSAYIASNGTLRVSVDADTTLADQLVMGTTDVELAKFKFEAGSSETVNISEIIVSDFSTGTGTIMNLSLYDGATKLAGPVQFGATTNVANARFSVSLAIAPSTSKTLTVKGDVATYDGGGTAGSAHQIGIMVDTGLAATETINARGASSGTSLLMSTNNMILAASGTTDADQLGSAMSVYRTKVSVAYASDTPTTAASGPDSSVAKINVTNSTNVGNYSATIKTINVALSQTGVSNTASRSLKIYKDSITEANRLVTTTWTAGMNQNFTDTIMNDAAVTDVVVSSGQTKTLYFLLDTSDAGTNDRLSIGMAQGDIEWVDGAVGSNITTVISLPLSTKTFSY